MRESGVVDVEIPEGIREIGKRAFPECKNLKSVTFPESFEVIGVDSFSDCTSLKEITLPKNVKKICSWAFSR